MDTVGIKFYNTAQILYSLASPSTGTPAEQRREKITAYILNPVLVNPMFTLYHISKTLERVVKAVYHLSVAFFSSLLALGSCGYFAELNDLAKRSWKFAGNNLYAGVVGASCTLHNVGCFFQGFFSIKRATQVQHDLIARQLNMNETCLIL